MPTLDYQVSDNADDAREADGVVGLANEGVVDETTEYYGHRWTVTIPSGATITAASIDLWILNDTNDNPNHTIYFEDNAAPAAFTTGTSDISNRTPTTATALLSSTDYGIPATGGWISDVATLPELKSIIQELVDSYDYSSGAAMVAIIQGSADASRNLRRMDYSTDTTKAAKLHIEYTVGGTTTTLTADAGSFSVSGQDITTQVSMPANHGSFS